MTLRIPYEHVKTAERSMRVVCEKMEAKISELPYNLPSDLYDYLAQDVVQQCYHMPNIHTTARIPHENDQVLSSTSLPTFSVHSVFVF